MKTSEGETETIKIRFAPDETGWASIIVDPGFKARICNVPITRGINIDDIVLLGVPGPDGFRPILEVLHTEYECKTTIQVEADTAVVHKTCAILDACGCKAEGLVPGILMVAHQKSVDVIALIEAAGIGVKNLTSP